MRILYLFYMCGVITSFDALASAKSPSYVYVGLTQPSIDLTINDNGADARNDTYHEILYEPMMPLIAKVGLSFKGWSIGLSRDVQDTGENSLDYTDYEANLLYEWWGMTASYSDFQKFKIAEQTGFAVDPPENEYHREDLALRFYSANFYLFPLRLNFDFGKTFDPAEDKTTGIGLGVIGALNRMGVHTEFGLLPEAWKDLFGGDGRIQSAEFTGNTLQAALSGSIKIMNFYAAFLTAMGPGSHSFSYQTERETRTGKGEQTLVRQYLSAGFIGKNLFSGVNLTYESPDYTLKFMTLEPSRSQLNVLVGTKF